MELSYWLATLDSAEIQMGNRCLTLWFHLYDLFLRPGSYRQQMKSTDSEGKHQVNKKSCPKDNGDSHPDDYTQLETDRLDALIELFEKGPIGEFTSRWKLVASIYCALNVWPGLGEQERLSSKRVVGNAVWFYAQFLPYVTDELNNLRKPIEKEMKGIVNITKWGHYSRFWSVKTSVDRCKKLIHKHVKNWESILQQPVRPIFESVIKIPNYLEPNADNNDNNHICSSAWLKLNMSEISSVLNQCSIRKSYHYLQQLYCRPNEGMNDLPSHLIRLPSLTKKLHKHLFTIVHHSPILQWIKHIRSGIHMWMTLVQDLSKQTEHLNSSCPSANQLTKFNKQKAYSKSKSHKHSSGDGGDDDEEEEELKKTRKWHQEFTALQQRKRLALSDWLKIATKKSSSSDQSHDIFDYEFSAPFDSDEVMNNNNECSEAKIHTDDQFFETLQLPNLGLSYRRGQRQTQTGHMSRFLVQLHGDPWSYVCQYIGHFNVDDNPDSDEFFIHSVCNRLSRLIALRASLPRVPGPSDGDADTSASILAELGGPNNLSRLVGIMDDLLNQCSVEFKVCSEFTSICRKMNQLVGEYAISLNVYNSKDEVDEINKQLVWCTNYSSDPDRIKRIRVSTQNLDQIIREHIYQWSVFWTVFQKQTTDEPFELSQLSNLFGTEAWTWLTANPKTLLSLSTENPNQLRTITESHLNPLKLAMHQVLKRTSQLLTLNTFLWNDAIHLYCKELCSSLERLQAVLAALIDSYKQMHCSGLFASVFHHLQQQITVESDRIHSELQVLCFTTSVEDDVHMLDTTTITANNDMGSMVVMIGRSEKQFEQLANRTIHSMLKAVEIIHISDQTVSNLDQISLLNHFSKMLSELMICTLPQVNRCLTSLRSMLQQSSSVVENANVNSKSIFHSRLMIVRCIYPLMDGLSKALCTRCIQFWSLLDAWFKLGEFAMQITGRLITEGFCRPANLPRDKNSQAADGTDATSGTSDNGVDDQLDTGDASSGGTSLTSNTGDTTGAKDVSNELECQEQIEGLLNDSKQENNDPGKKERDDTDGIEMPDDDFKGHYDDPEMENCNADDDITDQLDQENFDDKMGETDGSNEDLANEMWASDNDDDNEVKDDADSGNDKAKSNGVENDKSGTEKGGEQNTDNVQKQEKQNPEPKEEKDAADPCDKTDSSSQRKNPKRPQNTSGNRTTVANEDCMENESDQPEGSEATSPTKQNDDHDEHGLPTDCDSEYVDNAEEVPERDVDDLPADLFDNQMDIDNDKGGEEVEPFGQLEEEENNQSTLDDKDLNWNNEIETMDIDKQNVEDLTNVEAFPYHGSGSGDLNTQSNAFGGDDQDVENVDETQTDNMGQNADVNSTTQTPSQTTGNQSSQENASGEKYAQSNGGSQLDTSRLEPLGGQKQQQQSKRNQSLSGPKPTSENRSLANQQKPLSGVDTLEVDSGHHQQQQHDEQNSSSYDEQNTQLFQHLPNSSDPNNTGDEEDNDAPCVRDSATMDQVEKQLNSEGMKESGDTGLENDDSINNHDEDDHERLPTSELEPTDSATNILPEQNRQLHPYVKGKYPGGDEAVESDPTAEIVPTLGAQRPSQSIICTRLEVLLPSAVDTCMSEVLTDIQILDNRFAETSLEGSLEWAACCQRSGGVARQLCEALRLVLEPTKASRLRGDYRTGKRINMRKIIPYLASQFRKDKIWLRRSQPSQREYRILIAVDDSSSMSENLCKQMTFESLATVVTALNLLEVGRIGVCSFGEAVRVLHNPKDPWATDVGPRVLSQFTFEQPKTSLVQLLHCTIHLMNSIGYTNSSNAIPSQLLLILSDGVFSEDPQSPSLQAAVRLARDSHIFPVCLILDDVHKKHSIFDLRRYCGPGKLQPYMDVFPLPYYLVLRDLSCLPNLLADALRQWFELESSFGR
ncbi:unnamed protein product [Heterobilharzia americana]|nr:unnamed protein product [Heterobilharzia americana]